MEQKKVFRSRISVLVMIFLLFVFSFAFIPPIQYGDYRMLWIVVVPLLFVFLVFGAMRYKISMGQLHVNFFGNICISDIISIKRSYNPLSSPAGSLKRLRIEFEKGGKSSWILISPAREQEFIEVLKTINPEITVDVPDKKGLWRIWNWDI